MTFSMERSMCLPGWKSERMAVMAFPETLIGYVD